MLDDPAHKRRLGCRGARVALICPDSFTAWRFYRPLLTGLQAVGCHVWVISRPGEDVDLLKRQGIGHLPFEFGRFGSISKDLSGIVDLVATLRRFRFDYVHSFFAKLNAYGALAARLAGARHVFGTIEGLGFAYGGRRGLAALTLRLIVDLLHRLSGRLSDKLWFVNRDDRDLFVSRGFVSQSKTLVTKGHGIDLREYDGENPDPERLQALKHDLGLAPSSAAVAMIVARAIWSKGIREYVEMAGLLRSRAPHARFILVAPLEPGSPDAVPRSYLEQAVASSPNLCWLAHFRRDIGDILRLSDLVVLPSYYREGFPTILLEAMALAKPIVTTHNVGCRDAVVHGENGYLVPPRDIGRLADAVEEMVRDPRKRKEFGARSRRAAREECDAVVVVDQVLKRMYGLV